MSDDKGQKGKGLSGRRSGTRKVRKWTPEAVGKLTSADIARALGGGYSGSAHHARERLSRVQ